MLNISCMFLACASTLSGGLGSSLLSLLWIIFHLVVLLGFYLFPSSEPYFSAISFYLTFCVCGLLSIGCRVTVPLASGVCFLVGEFGSGAYAGFLVGGTGACPLVVDLGLVSLVGRAMSMGVFRGVCELSITLGSLSPDGWGCVPTLLVVWPKTSQHWSLKAVVWGQVSVPKWWPPGDITPINIPRDLHHQCPCSHSEPQPTPVSPGDPPRPASRSSPGFYQVATLCWAPVHMKPCLHPPSIESLFPPVLWSSCSQAPLAFEA